MSGCALSPPAAAQRTGEYAGGKEGLGGGGGGEREREGGVGEREGGIGERGGGEREGGVGEREGWGGGRGGGKGCSDNRKKMGDRLSVNLPPPPSALRSCPE